MKKSELKAIIKECMVELNEAEKRTYKLYIPGKTKIEQTVKLSGKGSQVEKALQKIANKNGLGYEVYLDGGDFWGNVVPE